MTLLPALQQWMVERRPLNLRYADDRFPRVVQPHAVFRAPDGELRLCALQVGGVSDTGRLPAWQDFALSRITDLEPLIGRFSVAPDFDPQASRFSGGVVAVVLR